MILWEHRVQGRLGGQRGERKGRGKEEEEEEERRGREGGRVTRAAPGFALLLGSTGRPR